MTMANNSIPIFYEGKGKIRAVAEVLWNYARVIDN